MSTQERCTGSSSQLNSEYGSPKPHHVVMATSAVPRTERRKSRGCESGWVSVTTPSLRHVLAEVLGERRGQRGRGVGDRKSTRLNSSHSQISYAVFCLKKKNDTRRYSN